LVRGGMRVGVPHTPKRYRYSMICEHRTNRATVDLR
jgi:hypothetical protein